MRASIDGGEEGGGRREGGRGGTDDVTDVTDGWDWQTET